MSEIIEAFDAQEVEKELNCDTPVIVDFWATWCYPCKLQSPILHDLKAEVGDKIKIVKVDVDANERIAVNFGIVSIPTLMLFKDGEMKEKKVGLTEKPELLEMIEKYI